MPLLGGLRQALCTPLSEQDDGHLAIYHHGLAVLSYVEDVELIPVLRGIGDSLRMNLLRRICALPWAVHALLRISQYLASSKSESASPDWSVSWIRPPTSPPLPTLLIPSTETLTEVLLTACTELSRTDCVKVIERGLYYTQASKQHYPSTAGNTFASHPEATLIDDLTKNDQRPQDIPVPRDLTRRTPLVVLRMRPTPHCGQCRAWVSICLTGLLRRSGAAFCSFSI
ncbi:hypothetical protein K466DRAFT_595874 [Polyporus arcularius HHB13444]|uniref:Uncharacterized protein n=1 Tax=Polyporus arcularius HHB13444 TaxID=1314778 RepID=A0A5C3PQF9_9APHY|nr:hypothetical protein K466DRAFT_595874 [Polyporus arcularius HHB13444]